VLLAFRAFNDPAVLGQTGNVPPGFWVDDVMIGSALISDGTSLDGWKSFTETRPNPVSGYTVRIISMRANTHGKIKVRELTLTGDFDLKGKAKVWKYLDRQADFVAAVVTYDDPSETSTQYAPHRLTIKRCNAARRRDVAPARAERRIDRESCPRGQPSSCTGSRGCDP